MLEEKSRVLKNIPWMLAPANDDNDPPGPGAPAVFWRHWMEKQALVWACSHLFQKGTRAPSQPHERRP